jgi:glycosyltransferase involved in cell wall biosynthesis
VGLFKNPPQGGTTNWFSQGLSVQPKRILILGIGPIPLDNPNFLHGTCLRTWQLAKTLHDDGHDLFLICFRVTGSRGDKDRSARKEVCLERLHYLSLTEEEFVYLPLMRQYYDEFRPDCAVGANTYPSSVLAQIGPEVPFWADINGYFMGEAQAKAARYQDDQYVKWYWDLELPALLAGDHFSVTSTPQKSVLIGELDVAGRLNRHTFGYEFVSVIPTGRESGVIQNSKFKIQNSSLLHGPVVPPDAFICLWFGGYNLWHDVETLFAGLERAMSRNPRIHYVSTGGAIGGHDDYSFDRLRAMIERSPHRERYHFVGWIPFDRVDALCRECDVGLNVDGMCYEAVFGARNRITDMMRVGLPVVTTVASEISEVVAAEECGFGFAVGDGNALAQALLFAADHPDNLARRGERGRCYFEQHYALAESGRPLREWAGGSPVKAPDWRSPNAAGWPMPIREADLRRMSWLRRMAYRYAKFGARGLLTQRARHLKPKIENPKSEI